MGAKDSKVSEEDLVKIRNSLEKLDNSDGGVDGAGGEVFGGKQLLAPLTKEKPLKILLNTSGVNSGKRGHNIMSIELEEMYFKDYSNDGIWRRVSLERLIAHEAGHAIHGFEDYRNEAVIMTDIVMSKINGTTRKTHFNQSGWCLSCD